MDVDTIRAIIDSVRDVRDNLASNDGTVDRPYCIDIEDAEDRWAVL